MLMTVVPIDKTEFTFHSRIVQCTGAVRPSNALCSLVALISSTMECAYRGTVAPSGSVPRRDPTNFHICPQLLYRCSRALLAGVSQYYHPHVVVIIDASVPPTGGAIRPNTQFCCPDLSMYSLSIRSIFSSSQPSFFSIGGARRPGTNSIPRSLVLHLPHTSYGSTNQR